MENTLLHTSLTGASCIRDCTVAATTLQHAAEFELPQGLSILQVYRQSVSYYTWLLWFPQAVTERKQHFESLSYKFGRRLQEHLTSLFVQQVLYSDPISSSLTAHGVCGVGGAAEGGACESWVGSPCPGQPHCCPPNTAALLSTAGLAQTI